MFRAFTLKESREETVLNLFHYVGFRLLISLGAISLNKQEIFRVTKQIAKLAQFHEIVITTSENSYCENKNEDEYLPYSLEKTLQTLLPTPTVTLLPQISSNQIKELNTINLLLENKAIVICSGFLNRHEEKISHEKFSSTLAHSLCANIILFLTTTDIFTPPSSFILTNNVSENNEDLLNFNNEIERNANLFSSSFSFLSQQNNEKRMVILGSFLNVENVISNNQATIIKFGDVPIHLSTSIQSNPFYTKPLSKWEEKDRYDWLRELVGVPFPVLQSLINSPDQNINNNLLSDANLFSNITDYQLQQRGIKKGLAYEIATEIRNIHQLSLYNPLYQAVDPNHPSNKALSFAYVESVPYHWPYNHQLRPDNTALIIIDMQVDFCGKGGYVDKMGYDISLTAAPILPIQNILREMRKRGFFIIHTREGHREDLTDLPSVKRWRSEKIMAGIGTDGPKGKILLRGYDGWDIISDLRPLPNEPIIDKPGKGSFCSTDLDLLLRLRGIQNIILTGVTTDVCVSTTMREANDRGYECLMLVDCTAATDPKNHKAIISMIHKQGGVFGCTSSSHLLLSSLQRHFPIVE